LEKKVMSLLPRNSLFDFGDAFENLYAPVSSSAANPGFFSPRVDINDKEDRYEIVADLPGVDKDHLSVTLEDGVLTIEASTEEEQSEEKEGRVIRKERRTGKYLRSFTLGQDVQETDIKASFKNGVLTLEAPKHKQKSPESKKIDIH
jgi:HSP20 family protein